MRYISLFSGIEAASVAWKPLGWECAAVAEIESFPSAVLAHHYPTVPNLGDVTKITKEQIRELGHIDVLIGGFPCQDLSVAGKRAGLRNEDGSATRSGLFFTGMQIAEWSGARFVGVENVPGLFSSNKGRDFAAVVGEMAGCEFDVPGDGWENAGFAVGPKGLVEWATLDAQFVRVESHPRAVPQRRRRVLIVRDSGNWTSRPPLFLERESLCGHPPPRRETRERLTACTAPSLTASGRGVERTGESRGQDPVIAVADTLRGHPRPGSNTTGAIVPATVGALTDGAHMGGGLTAKTPTQGGYSLLPETAGCLQERDAKGVDSDTKPGHLIPVQTGGGFDVAHSLKAEGFDASEDGTGRGTPLVPVAGAICKDSFSGGAGGRPEGAAAGHFVPCAIQAGATRSNPNSGPGGVGVRSDGLAYTLEARTEVQYIAFSAKDHGADAQLDLSPTLRAGGHSGSHANAGVMPAIAFQSKASASQSMNPSDVTPTLDISKPDGMAVAFDMRGREGGAQFEGPHETANIRASSGGSSRSYVAAMQVRRLTPKETLRLQGFPDDYLDILYRGKPAADGPKYRAVGNSMATNVMRFIGERIQAVEAISQEQEQAA